MDKFNKKRIKYLSIILSVVAILTVVVTTLTWLSSNNKLKATDVKMNVTASPNLIIAESKEKIRSKTISDAASPFTMEFSDNIPGSMEPATHNRINFAPNSTYNLAYDTGLLFVDNPEDVDTVTGMATGSQQLVYRTVPVNTGSETRRYYYDCKVYLASTEVDFKDRKIEARVVKPASASSAQEAYNACSIDFLINDIYQGTANTQDAAIIYVGDIPYNQSNSGDYYIEILMRCYYDGELKDPTTGNTYVRSMTSGNATSRIDMTVNFTALAK